MSGTDSTDGEVSGRGSTVGPRAGGPEPGDKLRALRPHARALRDYWKGDTSATLVVHSSLGEHDEVPVDVFFREEEDFFPFEEMALELCRGRVVDLGAGTGVHALALQGRGIAVTAVELVPEAVAIMRQRGVRRVVRGDLLEAAASRLGLEPHDTILMLMNGIGPVGTLEGLDRFLRRVVKLLAAGGQILVDSGEPLPAEGDGAPAEGEDARVEGDGASTDGGDGAGRPGTGGYLGEALIRLEYRGEVGPPFRELYVDQETLARRAAEGGWTCGFPFQDEHGGFLARLTRP